MRFFRGAVLVCAGLVCSGFAQTNADDGGVAQAKARIEKLRTLVEAGAAPRAQLARAEEEIADAEDGAFLLHTLYGQDLTDEQAEPMLAAANRRAERRQRELDQARKLVDAGVATTASLSDLTAAVERAQRECDLARSRAGQVHELTEMAEAERAEAAPAGTPQVAERHDGDGVFSLSMFAKVEAAFEGHFGKPLPVSAMGETAVHRAMGFDHRNRVDVAIHPDQPEGVWLRAYLDANRIPYYAFRQAVPGKATGAHIHLGPGSGPLAHGG